MVWGTSMVVQGLKNPPSNEGDTGSTPSQETKTLHAEGQLSHKYWALTPQGKILCAATKTCQSQISKYN